MRMSGSTRSRTWTAVLCAGIAALTLTIAVSAQAPRQTPAPPGYITGVVQSENGPEAGVWVIAETKDLPTNFIKIVVTDDRGRFMVPELPAANYSVFVRGYGLVDSPRVPLKPSASAVTLKAVVAKTPQ